MSRHDRVSEELRKEISSIIEFELNDPRLGFVTITQVELSEDMRYAKAFYSVLGKEEDLEKTKEALDSALGFVRRLIAQRIRLRFAPEITFHEDRSSEYSVRIQEALEEVKKLTEPAELPKVKALPKKKRARREPKKSSRVRKKK
jgi:ribosome-binding factor A